MALLGSRDSEQKSEGVFVETCSLNDSIPTLKLHTILPSLIRNRKQKFVLCVETCGLAKSFNSYTATSYLVHTASTPAVSESADCLD